MTVRELIKLLSELPEEQKDLKILSDFEKINRLKFVAEFPLGDYANPDCIYEDVILIE